MTARLLDETGAPLTGQHDLSVRLMTAETDGSELYAIGFDDVPADSGFIALTLSGADDDGDVLDDVLATHSGAVWIELTIDEGAAMARQRLAHVPRAARAEYSEGVLVGTGLYGAACTRGHSRSWQTTPDVQLQAGPNQAASVGTL